jgi:hypothetical protein
LKIGVPDAMCCVHRLGPVPDVTDGVRQEHSRAKDYLFRNEKISCAKGNRKDPALQLTHTVRNWFRSLYANMASSTVVFRQDCRHACSSASRWSMTVRRWLSKSTPVDWNAAELSLSVASTSLPSLLQDRRCPGTEE